MYILYLLLALVVLLVMVTIHEFGHYVSGKLLKFKINEFSIGFGKALFSKKKKNGEIFSIRVVPLGGYCAFEGEEEDSDNPQAFMRQKPWKRLIVLFSGAFFNFLSAIIFTVILLCASGYDIPEVYKVQDVAKIENVYVLNEELNPETYFLNGTERIYKINDVQIDINDENVFITSNQLGSYFTSKSKDYITNNQDVKLTYLKEILEDQNIYEDVYVDVSYSNNKSIDAENGLKPNDIIYKVNGTEISFITDNVFSSLVSQNSNNQDVTLSVKRNGEMVDISCDYLEYGIPKKVYTKIENEATITISASEYQKLSEIEKLSYTQEYVYSKVLGVESGAYKFSFGEALINSVPYTFGFAYKVLQSIWQLITGQLALEAVGGPITTITTMATFTQSNFNTLFVLLPLIAANLAVFNWLPIPALDGSKMVFTVIEMIRGKPINQKIENRIHTIGLFILFGLVIIADLYHIIF